MRVAAEYCLIYLTTKDVAEARRIGMAIVAERLVACVNILGGMQSIYWWEGAKAESQEAILIAKTRLDKTTRAFERIRGLHSYTCPCIVALPILEGDGDFLRWIGENTRDVPPCDTASKAVEDTAV
jgi:periplasmic divalent cation tolerance protein